MLVLLLYFKIFFVFSVGNYLLWVLKVFMPSLNSDLFWTWGSSRGPVGKYITFPWVIIFSPVAEFFFISKNSWFFDTPYYRNVFPSVMCSARSIRNLYLSSIQFTEFSRAGHSLFISRFALRSFHIHGSLSL